MTKFEVGMRVKLTGSGFSGDAYGLITKVVKVDPDGVAYTEGAYYVWPEGYQDKILVEEWGAVPVE